MSESDETLLARMLKGDKEAFTVLYRRRQGPIYRFALHMTNSVVAAEDITQLYCPLAKKTIESCCCKFVP